MSWKTLFTALLCAVFLPLSAAPIPLSNPVFINELHYDNVGADTGEAIELAGPAGFDLSGWKLWLYNGSNGEWYRNLSLSGSFTDQDDRYGVLSFALTGIQNGEPDGIALVASDATLVQFLSYEGSFIAADGPAQGIPSADIGLAQTSATPVGNSLALVGSGRDVGDFSWQAGPSSFGVVNTGQDFLPGPASSSAGQTGSVPVPASMALLLPLLGLLRRPVSQAPA